MRARRPTVGPTHAGPTSGAASATTWTTGLGLAVALVASWQVGFGALVAWGPDAEAGALLLPPLVALLVPVAAITAWQWWREPWLAGVPPRRSYGLLVPVVALEALVAAQQPTPSGLVLLAFLLTGLSEELLARGVVQQVLGGLPRLPQVLLSGGLLALGYAVTLTVLDQPTAKVLLVAGTVASFGVAHAALRRRGVPVLVLAAMTALVVWPQAAQTGYDPLTFVASVVALVVGVWATLDEPSTAGAGHDTDTGTGTAGTTTPAAP